MELDTFIGAFILGFACCGIIVMIINNKKDNGHIEPSEPWPRSISFEKPTENSVETLPLHRERI